MATNERRRVQQLFLKLNKQPCCDFPKRGERLEVSNAQGVYILRDRDGRVLHVGRTHRASKGLRQRLQNHIRGRSSFARAAFGGDGEAVRRSCTYQFLDVADSRDRALLECHATGWHCPQHLGVGRSRRALTPRAL